MIDNILERPPGEVRHSFLDAFGLWLEIAHIGKDKRSLVVALFGPGARRAAVDLVDDGWDRSTEHHHVIGGDCLEVGGKYVKWEVDKATTGGTALQVWITIGKRRYATVTPEVRKVVAAFRPDVRDGQRGGQHPKVGHLAVVLVGLAENAGGLVRMAADFAASDNTFTGQKEEPRFAFGGFVQCPLRSRSVATPHVAITFKSIICRDAPSPSASVSSVLNSQFRSFIIHSG